MHPIHKKYLIIWAILWSCLFVVIAALYIMLVSPQRKILKSVESELAQKRIEYNFVKASDSPISRQRWKNKIKELSDELSAYVAEANSLDDLAFSVSRIASQANVTSFTSRGIGDESYLPIQNCFNIGMTEMTVTFTASFKTFAKLVNTLERHKPVIFIDEFNIGRASRDYSSEHRLRMLLSVLVKIPEEDKQIDESKTTLK